MSALDGLLTPSSVASWLDKALAAGPAQLEKLPDSVRPLAAAALLALEGSKADIAKLAPDPATFLRVVSRIALGQGAEVAAAYVGTSDSFAARMAALDTVSAATRAEKDDRVKTWAAVAATSEKILTTLGKAALPFLLAIL